ncbi:MULTISPECIES: pyridoxal kinase [Dyella]|uniref:pyridoxal kinase n=2 Tax=Dyella TaxID=231454 RepID=A0A4R0YX13_9GAMM|nr:MULTISPECIES: pyridoxal kinase [Dyella]TBR39291.1 pyridoxal kinase [Dyella terrae]TCI13121.1 pyridoxal kinase [Dyella soli]
MSSELAAHLIHGRRQRPDGPAPVDIISVQSQLVYGHAGNSAAVPPLRQLGVRVAEVPTTLLSNAPFYATTRGRVLPADWLADLLLGARERGIHRRATALISGYLGSIDNGVVFAKFVDETLVDAPGLKYCLDPVIGDTHTGPYVEPGLETIFRERLLPHAWMVTPNAFELERLSEMPCQTERECEAAAHHLLAQGPFWVVTHSVRDAAGQLVTMAVSREEAWKITTPELPIDVAGTGDVLTAMLVAGVLLDQLSMPRALERAVNAVHQMLEATLERGIEEVDLNVAATVARDPTRWIFRVAPASRG